MAQVSSQVQSVPLAVSQCLRVAAVRSHISPYQLIAMATSKGTPASAASGSIGVRQTLQKRALKFKLSDKSMAGMAVDPAVEDAEVSSFGMTSAMIGAAAAPVKASGFSPDLKKRRETVEQFFGRTPAQPTTLAPPPPFPTGSSGSSDVHSASSSCPASMKCAHVWPTWQHAVSCKSSSPCRWRRSRLTWHPSWSPSSAT